MKPGQNPVEPDPEDPRQLPMFEDIELDDIIEDDNWEDEDEEEDWDTDEDLPADEPVDSNYIVGDEDADA